MRTFTTLVMLFSIATLVVALRAIRAARKQDWSDEKSERWHRMACPAQIEDDAWQ